MNTQKIWQTGKNLDPMVEAFTVGQDYLLDQKLLPYDIKASLAHAEMLKSKGVLTDEEYVALKKSLNQALSAWEGGDFVITQAQEDGHTALEQWLTEQCGEAGKKIHTGRSRNDQSLVMLRLYMLDQHTSIKQLIKELIQALETQANVQTGLPLPGYTHTQKAMPTTVTTWLASFVDGLSDQLPFIDNLSILLDQSPLGSASGFGINNFANDRDLTAKTMGFSKVQKNPLYCGLSRGQFEAQFLQTFVPSLLLVNRLATDLMLFTTQEFNYVSLPANMTTGSSIMPQKRNYDVLEIMRGRINQYFSRQQELTQLCRGLISGYHRDLQLSKEIFVGEIENITVILKMLTVVVQKLNFNAEKLESAMTSDLFVTEQVYDLVNQGMPFREAYLKVKKEFSSCL